MRRGAGLLLLTSGLALVLAGPASSQRAAAPNPELTRRQAEYRDETVRADTTARAMRLIGDGVVDREGVDGLASRLGYSVRQVQRLTLDELGASPLALEKAEQVFYDSIESQVLPLINDVVARVRSDFENQQGERLAPPGRLFVDGYDSTDVVVYRFRHAR